MKPNRKSFLVKLAVLTVLAGCLGARTANAQELLKGTFTLPFEARWGLATLAPGDYSFTVDRASGPYRVIVRGEGKSAMILGLGESTNDLSGQSHLTAVRTGSGYRIRSLEVTDLGSTLFFGMPKAEKAQMIAQVPKQVPVLIRRGPVAHGGK